MRISDVLRGKGSAVVTVNPQDSVRRLLALLHEHRIGALVVSADGHSVEGIVSERDVVRHLHDDGDGVLDSTVEAIMSRDVETCEPGEDLESVMVLMTERRFRHVPVVGENGALVGIVSIGDVVKHRIETLQGERDQLVGYISS